MNLFTLFVFISWNAVSCMGNNVGATSEQELSKESQSQSVTISGKILPPEFMPSPPNWQADTQLILKGGLHKAFLREDGAFSFYNIPPGSYVLEVINPTFTYEPLRVEINSKGKIRARKVNYIQASQVIQVNYPLKMKPLGMTRYFQVREQWRITDFLFNPMDNKDLLWPHDNHIVVVHKKWKTSETKRLKDFEAERLRLLSPRG